MNFLVLQAFLEMADELSASTMVTYFTSCMAQLRGHAVYVQFSNHKELKTDQTHSNAVSDTHIFMLYPEMTEWLVDLWRPKRANFKISI